MQTRADDLVLSVISITKTVHPFLGTRPHVQRVGWWSTVSCLEGWKHFLIEFTYAGKD